MKIQRIRTNADGEIEHYYEDVGASHAIVEGMPVASYTLSTEHNVQFSGKKRPSGLPARDDKMNWDDL